MMAENTKIEWCDHTWNPWRGCQHAVLPDGTPHPGCANCYAEAMSKRNPATLGQWGGHGTRIVAANKTFNAPERWNKRAERLGHRQRVFVDSLSDFFEGWRGPMLSHDECVLWECTRCPIWHDGEKPYAQTKGPTCTYCMATTRPLTMDDARNRAFDILDRCDWLDFVLLTKRPQNVPSMWPCMECRTTLRDKCYYCGAKPPTGLFRSNVHLLYSASDQPSLAAGIDHLLACRPLVPVLGLSLEPLVGPIEFRIWDDQRDSLLDYIDWVIVGGESGPHARPMHPDWVRSIRDQCVAAGVPFFFKQWGEWEPAHHYWSSQADGETVMAELVSLRSQYQLAFGGDGGLDDLWRHRDTVMVRAGKKAAGRELDWREWNELPQVQR